MLRSPSPSRDAVSGQDLLISAGVWTLPDLLLCAQWRFWDNKGRIMQSQQQTKQGFPGGSVVKSLLANARDTESIPDLGRSHRLWSN